MNNPTIISFGDPGSINSEILVKSFSLLESEKKEFNRINDIIIIGSSKSLNEELKKTTNFQFENRIIIKNSNLLSKSELKFGKILNRKVLEILFDKLTYEIYQIYLNYRENKKSKKNENLIIFFDPFESLNYEVGEVDLKNGFLSYLYLIISCKLIEFLKYNANLLTLPLNKKAVSLYDKKFKGHTDFLMQRYNAPKARMLMHCDKLSILMETNHVPILDLKNHLNRQHFFETLFGAKEAIIKLKLEPIIYVLGLNPHKSDGSLIGTDEERWIIPQIEKFNKIENSKIIAEGPFSSDSIFTEKSLTFKKHGIFIAWYHDQGLIPFKMLAKENGANITVGLPFFRISPDHGTGFDIVGKNVADPSSLVFCLKTIYSLEER